MKVDELIEKLTINPMRDITPNFTLTKQIRIDAARVDGCFNCGDKSNQRKLISAPWTGVQHCWACNHINVITYVDHMSGVHEDFVECYTDK